MARRDRQKRPTCQNCGAELRKPLRTRCTLADLRRAVRTVDPCPAVITSSRTGHKDRQGRATMKRWLLTADPVRTSTT